MIRESTVSTHAHPFHPVISSGFRCKHVPLADQPSANRSRGTPPRSFPYRTDTMNGASYLASSVRAASHQNGYEHDKAIIVLEGRGALCKKAPDISGGAPAWRRSRPIRDLETGCFISLKWRCRISRRVRRDTPSKDVLWLKTPLQCQF